MKVRVIANPASGGGRGHHLAEALVRELHDRVDEVDLVLTQQKGDAEHIAAEGGFDCIASVGGDGTLNGVVNGVGHSDTLVAVLPAGTANVVARQLGVLPNPERVAHLIAERSARWMDAGLFKGRRFLLGAGAGLDAAVTAEFSARRGNKSSLVSWVWPTVKTTLSYHYPIIRVTVDGREISDHAQYAIVGNCRYSAAVFPATPNAKIDDGLLDVCVLHNLNALKMLYFPLAVWRKGFFNRQDVEYVQGHEIELAPGNEECAPLQMDGDPAGHIPAQFKIEPKAVQMVCPIQT